MLLGLAIGLLISSPPVLAAPASMQTYGAPFTSGREFQSYWATTAGCGASTVSNPTAWFGLANGTGDLSANASITACPVSTNSGNPGSAGFYGQVGVKALPFHANSTFTSVVQANWTLFLKLRIGDNGSHNGSAVGFIRVKLLVWVHDDAAGSTTYAAQTVWHGKSQGRAVSASLINRAASVSTAPFSFVKGHNYAIGSILIVYSSVTDIKMHSGKVMFASVVSTPPYDRLDSIQIQ